MLEKKLKNIKKDLQSFAVVLHKEHKEIVSQKSTLRAYSDYLKINDNTAVNQFNGKHPSTDKSIQMAEAIIAIKSKNA